ncbi:MAG: hypothetical protein LUE31_12050 [Lachnospiraceae bacterium]|nr:hypothetical protein [Lachnospiraceae bacterium]
MLTKKIRIGSYETELSSIFFLTAVTLLAFAVRVCLHSFVSDDWTIYWSDWLAQLSERGFGALADDFYDYAPPVMYLLYLITLLPLNAMTVFKGICCLMDFVGAALVGKLVFTCTGSKKRSMLGYACFLFLPTVILNSAAWAQCDILYTVLILASVYFLLTDRSWAGMWFYGAAFAVKLQTLFIFPFLVILWVRKKVDLKQFLTLPVMYFLGILPAWIAGRPLTELIGIYAFQGSKDRWSLSIKFPNIYQIIGNNFFLDEYAAAGMYLILGILMILMFYLAYKRVRVTKEYVILLIVFFGMVATYFLPHMHERYLYVSDAFLLVYTLMRVRRFPWFVASSFLGVVGYGQYLTKNDPLVPYWALAFVQLALIVRIGLDLWAYVHDPANLSDEEEETALSLRTLIFHRFHIGSFSFDFLEALLAVCITAVGVLLRTVFAINGTIFPALVIAVATLLVWTLTRNGRRTLLAYAVFMILPTLVADAAILPESAAVGAVLFLCALEELGEKSICVRNADPWGGKGAWIFTAFAALTLLNDVRYVGLLVLCALLWNRRRLRTSQFLVIFAAGLARLLYSYRSWLWAGYTLTTFHWPNIYEIVGKAAVTTQQVDPIALVGLFLAAGLLLMALWVFAQGSAPTDDASLLRFCLFFGIAAGFFLPYMDQSYGYVYCVIAAILAMKEPREFWIPLLLQIVTYAGYQDCVNGESMTPMWVFALLQLGILTYLGVRLLREAKVVNLCAGKN